MNQRFVHQKYVVSKLDVVHQPADRRLLLATQLPKYPAIQALPGQGCVWTLIAKSLQQFEASRSLSLQRSLDEVVRNGQYSTRSIATARRLLEEGKDYALSYLLRDEE